MACREACLTKDHANWGECMRSVNLHIGYAASAKGMDYTTQKKWDNELALYQTARKQGIQPDSTKTKDIRRAIDISEKIGKPYGA